MSYPQYPPQGGGQYPPPNPAYGARPPGPCPPPRKSTPGWVWALVAVGAVLWLGVIGSVFGGTGESDSAAAESSTVRASATAPALSSVASPAPGAPAVPAAAAPSAVMPAVVCMNLQDAQDLIQTAGVFYSRSTDATGAGRNQVLDRNWVVVAQMPAPGALIGEGDAVLSVVKIGEPNNCV